MKLYLFSSVFILVVKNAQIIVKNQSQFHIFIKSLYNKQMSGSNEQKSTHSDPYIQSLLDSEPIIQAKLQELQEDLDFFQTFHLQTSWRTGNIYAGWPKVSFSKMEQFISKTKAKKSYQMPINIDQYQKIFSISSVSSKPFSLMSQLNFTANKSIECQSRPKINKRLKKKKTLKIHQTLQISNKSNKSNEEEQLDYNQARQLEDATKKLDHEQAQIGEQEEQEEQVQEQQVQEQVSNSQ